MGTGEHGRQLVAALQSQDIPVTLTTLHPEAAPEDARSGAPPMAIRRSPRDATFNLLCVNAEGVPAVAKSLGKEFFADRYTVGFWAWEVSAFPGAVYGRVRPRSTRSGWAAATSATRSPTWPRCQS